MEGANVQDSLIIIGVHIALQHFIKKQKKNPLGN
jgi:hypothetical protein